MPRTYRLALHITHADGSPVERVPIEADWEPAQECVWFLGLRKGHLSPRDSIGNPVFKPLWHERLGPPYLRGFRMERREPGETPVIGEFGTTYFAEVARRASTRLVEQSKLQPGETFLYRPLAFPVDAPPRQQTVAGTNTEMLPPELTLRDTALEPLVARGLLAGAVEADDFPVFLPRRVLDEGAALSRRAGNSEAAGILIGHLHRDPRPEVFVEVTALVPAQHTVSTTTRVTFTARTWAAAQAAIDLRRREERMLGWFHSHPVHEFCKNCGEEEQKRCPRSHDFFSDEDHHLHRTVFPRAFHIALVANDTAFAPPTFSMFAWRQGSIVPRGFHVLRASGKRLRTTPEAPVAISSR